MLRDEGCKIICNGSKILNSKETFKIEKHNLGKLKKKKVKER